MEEQLAKTETTNQGMTKWINKGIDLEDALDKLWHDALNTKKEGTPCKPNILNEHCKQLLSCINAHHQEQEQYL
ncbi:hypothetical protein RhiXN_12066 [Rhizoctonia solani]|uniref:Uncharacterized protein n=1 Tax=Rhizoctonia solani TaxID=456999 RepID=A0A8H8P749_9AGAM|nr:uncharacterized protein RhiXN_12066 [Rhizoctonia solani]QRW26405.1 hypothetical protein RhiXN_12066 [Rhizoctonia solani]